MFSLLNLVLVYVVLGPSAWAEGEPKTTVVDFPAVEAASISDDVGVEARALLETEIPDVKLEVVHTRGARALTAGHGKQLQAMIAEMAKRLGVANDPRDVTVTINANPTVNAQVTKIPKTSKVNIELNAGLLAFVKNQDELATVLAHEMTHANSDIFRFKDDPTKIKDLLKSIPTSASPIQTEELRADLGAIHRMIKGGYNPWGGYEVFKSLSKYQDQLNYSPNKDSSSIRAVSSFLSSHPASELRMSVVKSFITARQQRENLSQVTSKFNEFSPGLKMLKWRMNAYSAFANANKTAMALRGVTVSAAALSAQIGTALMVSPDTAAHLGVLLTPGQEAVGGISSVLEYLHFGPPSEAGSPVRHVASNAISEIFEFGRSIKDMPLEKAAKVIAGFVGSGAAGGWAVSKLHQRANNAKERALDAAYQEVVSDNRIMRNTRLAVKRTADAVKLHRQLMAIGEFDRTGTLVRTLNSNVASEIEAQSAFGLSKINYPDLFEFSRYFFRRSRAEFLQRQVVLNELIEEYMPRLSEKQIREIANVIESQSSRDLVHPDVLPSYRRMLVGFRSRFPQMTFSRKIERIIAAKENANAAALGSETRDISATLRQTDELLRGRHVLIPRSGIPSSKFPNQAIPTVNKSSASSDHLESLIKKNVDQWLDEIEIPGDQGQRAQDLLVQGFREAVINIRDSRGEESAVQFQLEILEKVKARWKKTENLRILFLPKELNLYGDFKTRSEKKLIKTLASLYPWKRFWKEFDGVKTIVELDELITSKYIKGQGLATDGEPLRQVYELVVQRPDLLASPADVKRLLDREYLWNRIGSGYGNLDRDILTEIRKKVGSKTGSDLWNYRPESSEKIQKRILGRMKDFGMEATSKSDRLTRWQQFVGRGVTATSDQMFAELYDSGSEADRKKLRQVSNGRIWEPQLRSRVLKDRIREMPEYKSLIQTSRELSPSRGTQSLRLAALRKVIQVTEAEFEGRGTEFNDVVESVLRDSKSSQLETRFADRYRGTMGKGQTDITMRTLSALTEKVKAMSPAAKWDYILWLRGEKAASQEIEGLFPAVGADRVGRMYSLLPDFQKALVIDTVLDSGTGLLPTANVNSKWGRKIIDHLIGTDKRNDPEALKARQVAKDVLEAYLDSFDGPGVNKSQRTLVLSYMLASKSGDGSVGRVLKQVLEAMGASGIKIGQLIVAADILGESDNQILRQLQDQANVPQRSRIYRDLVKASGGRAPPGKVDDLLGAASMKYAVKLFEVEDGHPFVLKVLREEASATIGQQFTQLKAMSDNLMKKHKGKYSVLRSFVRASEEAVNRELKLVNEVKNSADATRMIYANLDDFKVPKETLVDQTVIRSEFASGTSIHDLTLEQRGQVAQRIIDVEGANLFADKDVIYFDPDRHPGNFIIAADKTSNRIQIKPIDFGQVIAITSAERQSVIDLFAQSAILDKTGATKWSAEQIANSLALPKEKIGKLKSVLSNGFPAKNRSSLASYYTLLAALEDIGHPQPIQFFDFARAVVQHNQYISMVEESLVAKGKTPEQARGMVRAPRDELTERVKKSVSDQMGAGAPYGATDKIRIVWNQGSRKVEEFVADTKRASRAGIGKAVTAIKKAPSDCSAWFSKLNVKMAH